MHPETGRRVSVRASLKRKDSRLFVLSHAARIEQIRAAWLTRLI
jgi:hypothetical protein